MAKVYDFNNTLTSNNDNIENDIGSDIENDIDNNIDTTEQHVFSEEYNRKKQHILEAYEELPKQNSKPVIKVAIAVLAFMLISGTAMAYNSDVLDSFFSKGKEKLDAKYRLIDLARTSYNDTATVTTNLDDGNIDVSVLAAMKGEHTITVAFLLTMNDIAVPDIPGYSPIHYDTYTGKESLIGIDKPVSDPDYKGYSEDGLDWDGSADGFNGRESEKNDYGLNKNQILMYNEYVWDEDVDISKVTGMVFTVDNITLEYVSDEDDGYGNYDMQWKYILSPDEDEPLKITVAFTDEAYKDYDYEINDTIEAFKDEYFIDHVSITPISLSVWLDVDKTEALNDIKYSGADPHIFYGSALMPNTDDKIYLIMSDGEKIKWRDIGSSASGGKSQDKKLVEDSLWFDVPIDPSQVAGVQIDKKTIMFGDYK